MILVRLSGGIGNQMFQYAAGCPLAERHATRLCLDTSWFDNVPKGHTARPYELDQLSITGVVSKRCVHGVRTAKLLVRPLAYATRVDRGSDQRGNDTAVSIPTC